MRLTIAVVTACVGLAAAVDAGAQESPPPAPVQITSGEVTGLGGGRFTVAGANFSFTQPGVPIDPPDRSCRRGCPGGRFEDVSIVGSDFINGTVVYNGVTYGTGPGPLGNSLVIGGFRGAVTLPPVSPGTIGIPVQLTFAAEFWHTPPAGVFERTPLVGSGTGVVVFTAVFPEVGEPLWFLTGLQYRITPPVCPAKPINDAVSVSVNSTSFDPTPVPGGPAGTFFIDATLTNTSAQTLEGPIKLVVGKLTGSNRLLSATEGAGGVWSKQIVAQTLAPGATVQHVSMAVSLATRNPFEFFVDAEACASVDSGDTD
jgi:hypothetical protein